ncbi:transposase [Streptomyces sp. ALI-76-A]|uniref:transposase n=1 Tax=Streptomyces sp. ALI-76-A TaxID=3025736 RepID=UPI00256F243C|nr:transposase [Streptomyces sp. ALI-76-A]MDL5206512.1 transposase [Streptomyces sp. ALI-76-A]
MSERKPYPSDLSDARWALIEPTLTAWRKARLERRPTGQPAKVELRDVFDALLYINRTGIPWKYLPHDFPGHGTVYFYYAAWRDEGILAQLNYDLTGLARVKDGRKPEPTASVIDIQSVKASTKVPLTSQGLLVMVTAASVSDNEAGKQLLSRIAADHPTITKAWVDTGHKTQAIEHGATLGIDVDVVPRNTQIKGFSVVPRRWVVERSFGWIMMHRRLARDYETKPAHSESMIRLAMISNLARRATGETPITWHNP